MSVDAQNPRSELRNVARLGVKANKESEDSEALYALTRWTMDDEPNESSTACNSAILPMKPNPIRHLNPCSAGPGSFSALSKPVPPLQSRHASRYASYSPMLPGYDRRLHPHPKATIGTMALYGGERRIGIVKTSPRGGESRDDSLGNGHKQHHRCKRSTSVDSWEDGSREKLDKMRGLSAEV